MSALTAAAADFGPHALTLDAEAEVERIVGAMRAQLRKDLKRRGLVLGLSGGIDSSLCAALAARAVGAKNASSAC
jgi:NAD+ synthase